MKYKYVCPDCGGRLAVWREKLLDVETPINMKTGKRLKKCTFILGHDYTDCMGIVCLECNHRTYNVKDQSTFENDITEIENEIFENFDFNDY